MAIHIIKTALLLIGLTIAALLVEALPAFAAEVKIPEYLDEIQTDENDSRLNYPALVYAEPVTGEIYVNQGLNLVIYSPDLFPLFTFGRRQGISGVWSLAVDAKGNTYIATGGTMDQPVPKIAVYDAAFRLQRKILFPMMDKGEPYKPDRIAIDRSGTLYVLHSYDTKVLVCDLFGKQFETLSVLEGDESAPLVDIQIDGKGRIYLVNERDGRIYVFDEQRSYLFKFGEKGGSSGKLSRPVSIAIDADIGVIYVNDYMRHAVNLYDYAGNYFAEIGGLGYGPGWFQYPSRVAADRSGRLFVADTFNSRIQVFKWKDKPDLKGEQKAAGEGEPKK